MHIWVSDSANGYYPNDEAERVQMLSRWVRTWYAKPIEPLILFLAKLGITPNALTVSGLLFVVIAGILLALGQSTLALFALVFGAFLDGIDGRLAQAIGRESALGAFLDSICDHLGDLAIYLGLLWTYLQANAALEIVLILLALFGSVFGSHVRSRAGMVGIDTEEIGIFTRFERMLVLIGGLLVGETSIALGILAIFNNLSAVQRVIYSIRAYQSEIRTK